MGGIHEAKRAVLYIILYCKDITIDCGNVKVEVGTI